jgi:hypothetical protein
MELKSGIPNHDNNLPPLSSIPNQESIEYIPKWKHIQEDLNYLFQITIDDEASLSSEKIKKELYEKAVKDLCDGEYFALDYMFEEGLLSIEDLHEYGILNYKDRALQILQSLRSTGRYNQAKNLFIATKILSEEEIRG